MEIFEGICHAIQLDVEKTKNNRNEYVSIEEQNNKFIKIFDAMDGEVMSRFYTIRNPEYIDEKYLSSIIFVSDEVENSDFSINKNAIVKYMNHMDKNMLMTLNRVYFITGEEEDTDNIYKDDTFSEAVESGHYIDDNEVGITWWDYDAAVINVKAIEETMDDMDDGFMNRKKEMDFGVLTTMVHEIRHVAQSNLYLPEFVLKYNGRDNEDDAETYARNWVDNHYMSVVVEKKKTRDISVDINKKIENNRGITT